MNAFLRPLAASLVLLLAPTSHSADAQPSLTAWQTFLSPAAAASRLQSQPDMVPIDVRTPAAYAAGHLPGAINLPAQLWRTTEPEPGAPVTNCLFRKPDGSPDVARYEAMLGAAGLTRERPVLVYGNHAGKADGSMPAMILIWLGQKNVAFLDGVGMQQWQSAGQPVSTTPRQLPPDVYHAAPVGDFVWDLAEVQAHIGESEVVFLDCRSPEEYRGEDLRGNKRGGHIPGAILYDYSDLLDPATMTVITPEVVARRMTERGVTPDKTVVLYCQTATRVSVPLLALRELGYEKLAIYDASWLEYGNREDTKIAVEPKATSSP